MNHENDPGCGMRLDDRIDADVSRQWRVERRASVLLGLLLVGATVLSVLVFPVPSKSGSAPAEPDAGARSFLTDAARGASGAEKWCPRGKERSGFRVNRLIGRSVRAARRLAEKNDCEVRVVRRGNKDLAITSDLRFNRVNVAVRQRMIVEVEGVF